MTAAEDDHRKKRPSHPSSTGEKSPQDEQGEWHLEDTAGGPTSVKYLP